MFDSGASISAISEDFFSTIKSRAPSPKSLSILPVSGVTISTAVNGKSKKITTQVFLKFTLLDHVIDGIFLVVPHLATPVILGEDWLHQNGVIINYLNKSLEFPRWKQSCPFKDDLNEIPASHLTSLRVCYIVDDIVTPSSCHCLSKVNQLGKFFEGSSTANFPIISPEQPVTVSEFQEHVANVSGVTDVQRAELVHLLEEYKMIFNDHPGSNKLYTCRFNVTEDVPFKVRPYPIPFSRRPAVDKELQRMLDWGVVERCSSAYSNPIICVGKPDGSVRLCLDARKINRLIIPMRDTSSPLNELLAQFGGKSLFSSLDFTAGYWQIPLHQEVRKYTAFVYNGRTYQFCVVPFGLNIANTAFSQALETVLKTPINGDDNFFEDLHVYVDDVLVSTSNFTDHLSRLRNLFQKILISGMTLKLSKCKFLRNKIKFLGHIVTPEGMTMDPEKLQAIHDFPPPRNKREMQSFIGFCNFYRKFADHHASKIGPLNKLIEKGKTWHFGQTELEMFNSVKMAFSEIYLSHPDFNSVFYLQTDASILGLGAELFQLSSGGERRTICFASRTLQSAERNYSITELELLSIVFACEKFRVFILGYPIHVLTDHQALIFLFRCRMRNARLSRWTLLLQEFDLHVEYIPGVSNVIDALSRNPIGREDETNEKLNPPYIFEINSKVMKKHYQYTLNSFKSIIEYQRQDRALQQLIQKIKNTSTPQPPFLVHYCVVNDVLFYRRYESSDQWLIYIPVERVSELIIQVHEHFGHVGPKKCIQAMRDFCYFKSMYSRTRETLRSCNLCQRAKPNTIRIEGEMHSIMSDVPLGRVLVDLYGPLPPGWNKVCYIFVVLDNFSRFVRLYPVKKATAVAVTNRMVDDFISTYGKPNIIVSDHGVQFTSKIWQRRLSEAGVITTMTSVYHPQSNPAERVMRELGRMFRTYCHEQHNLWPQYVTYVEWVLNNTVHEATGYTPKELFLATDRYNPFSKIVSYPNRVPVSNRTKMILAHEVQQSHAERRKKRHDQQGKPTSYKIGSLVLVRSHNLSSAVDRCIRKFFLLYDGPYIVVECKSPNAYVVADPITKNIVGTYNVIFLRKYLSPPSDSFLQAEEDAVSQKP